MIDVVWLAGFFDGEGTVGVYKNGPSGYKTVKVSVPQCNERIIREIHDAYPEGHVRLYAPKNCWYFAISGSRPSERFLRDIAPHLRLKRERVDEALLFIEEVKKGRTRKPNGRFAAENR